MDWVIESKSSGEPWLWLIVALPATLGVFVVALFAAFVWLDTGIAFKKAMDELPYSNAPVLLFLVALSVLAVETWRVWLPKIPSKAAQALEVWLSWLCAPYFAPLGRLLYIREVRAGGEKVSRVYEWSSLIHSFLFGVSLSIIALVIPFLVVVIVIGG